MKSIFRFMIVLFVLALTSTLLPAAAQAYPYLSRQCTDCHLLDSNVVVTAEPLGCTVRNGQTLASYDYHLTVSDTYESLEGYAVFEGLPSSIAHVQYGYGPLTGGVDIVLSLDQNKTFTIRGTSDSDIYYNGNGKGGSNYVVVTTPLCAACEDLDGDGYYSAGGSCGKWDCNDQNASINPLSAEVPNNGIDEDCNGYDLTIVITKAQYSTKNRSLTIEAASQLGTNAGLSAAYSYTTSGPILTAPMTWNAAIGKWQATISNVTTAPSTVTVSGIEGASTAKVTKGK